MNEINQGDIDKIAEEIKKSPVVPMGAGAKNEFCRLWPQAEQVLSVLNDIVGSLPGFGLFAKAAISTVLVAGKGAAKALNC